MQGLRHFIHHTNPSATFYTDTQSILRQLDAGMADMEPPMTTLLGKSGTGKSGLLQHWVKVHRQERFGVVHERQPILVAEVSDTERRTFGKKIYTTPIAGITFSSIMYELGELARKVDSPSYVPPWYRQERSIYTDQQFVWLFDQVCREVRRLKVRAIIIDDAHRLDAPTLETLMRLRRRMDGHLGLILSAQLAQNEALDEPLGTVFERARVDPDDRKQVIVMHPITEEGFYNEIVLEVLGDLDAEIDAELVPHGSGIAQRLWQLTKGDWKSITSRVRYFNRLLPPQGSGERRLTKAIVEQVLECTL